MNKRYKKWQAWWFAVFGMTMVGDVLATEQLSFEHDVRPVLSSACIQCHGPDAESRKAGLRLDTRAGALAILKSGRRAIVPGDVNGSELLTRLTHADADERMPPEKSGKTVSPEQINAIAQWIEQGAKWEAHWAFRPLVRPAVPAGEAGNPIDAFIADMHTRRGLSAAPEADRFTLIRRLYYDLIGLPPTPEEVEAFVADSDPEAYEKLVTRLLDSPHYGERWARHWLDVVKYADTHGYDKDKMRPHAWPYRDYVIRAFNNDKPYGQFVREQIAGDVVSPGDPDGVIALGFLAAGPWDFIGHAEVPESKIDGQVARSLDRDDMVCNTINTFNSLTIQCARCHDHKFDPFTQEHYYGLQAVFASIDRADREFNVSPEVTRQKNQLQDEIVGIKQQQNALGAKVKKAGGERLQKLNEQLVEIREQTKGLHKPLEHGWHSQMAKKPDVEKWVQVDLEEPIEITRVVLRACFDDFGQIGAGFGFPLRYKVSCSNDPEFKRDVTVLQDETAQDSVNPKLVPVALTVKNVRARYVRITATKLFHRVDTYIFALAELEVMNTAEQNVAAGKQVRSLDSIEAPARWRRSNLVDGKFPRRRIAENPALAKQVREEHAALMTRIETPEMKAEQVTLTQALKEKQSMLNTLPAGKKVYAGMVYKGGGNFTGRYGKGPRDIHVLHRGEVSQPGERIGPGALPLFSGDAFLFDLPAQHDESDRRAALAEWITRDDHPLTWRSIVNRVWQYHFGRGLADSPNDFGRMGEAPSHPELLDWLAVEFRDNGQSMKKLHRLIVTSAVYRQSSSHRADFAAVDGSNRYLWRQNRRRLDAESLRDSVLQLSGKLDRTMYGPGYFLFAVEKATHSPHYEYHKHDPDDSSSHRRSVYRFVVRSQPDPFMTTLDCADSSQSTPKRSETITALQALSLMNNKFNLAMATHFADRVTQERQSLPAQVTRAYTLATGRAPSKNHLNDLVSYAEQHGMDNVCRLIFNLNEFVYVE